MENRALINKVDTSKMAKAVLEEYSTASAVRKYASNTAGAGIGYLLRNEYGAIYREVIHHYVLDTAKESGLNILEFGCGAGMNLIYMVSLLDAMGIKIRRAIGTDISEPLLAAANRDAEKHLSMELRNKIIFCKARNESLIEDMAYKLGLDRKELLGSFHIALGINTVRYCHRLGNEAACAQGIYDLLAGGCACIIIDMNKRYPFFRSRLRDRLTKGRAETYLPSLDEYARPFSESGFDIIRKSYFSWTPHSAGHQLVLLIQRIAPILDRIFPSHAMRCLVVSSKPICVLAEKR